MQSTSIFQWETLSTIAGTPTCPWAMQMLEEKVSPISCTQGSYLIQDVADTIHIAFT